MLRTEQGSHLTKLAVDTTEWVTVTLAQLPSMTAAEKQIISGAQLELSNAASALLTQGSLRRGEVSFWLHNNPSRSALPYTNSSVQTPPFIPGAGH